MLLGFVAIFYGISVGGSKSDCMFENSTCWTPLIEGESRPTCERVLE